VFFCTGTGVMDRQLVDVDTDPAFYFDAYMNPAFHFDDDPELDSDLDP
jgi:hypothetical protein